MERAFFGYCETAKAYRIPLNDDGKIIITRDVQIVGDQVMSSDGTGGLNVVYTHPDEENPKSGRVVEVRRSCKEHGSEHPACGDEEDQRSKILGSQDNRETFIGT